MISKILIALLLCMTTLGFVSTYAILLFGLPDAVRLQNAKRTLARFHKELPLIAINLLMLIGGAGLTFPLIEHKFTLEMPALYVIPLDLLFIVLLDDAFFYAFHRTLHENRYLYRTIHRIHHQAYAPLPLEYIYVHPLEWMLGAIGPVVAIAALVWFHGQMSAYSFLIYVFLRQAHELNLHSGVRSVLSRYVPILGKTDTHDYHHKNPTKGNYASMLAIWDRVLGTASPVTGANEASPLSPL